MIDIYENSSEIEKKAKENYSIPDFIMMENAASEICSFIKDISTKTSCKLKSILILCGKGNNGGDGLAVARKLQNSFDVFIYCPDNPTAFEAKTQFEICKKLNLTFLTKQQFFEYCKTTDIFLDCLYGTGFHGELKDDSKTYLEAANSSNAVKIACDIPSAFYFKADYTITMGELKIELFSDLAKNFCGKIICANLGLSAKSFTENTAPIAKLIEKSDMNLPFRRDKSVHKGKFGHSVIFAGEKSGAGILAATSALNFGTGLSSLYQTEKSNLNQFKISPQLMICSQLPQKTTSILLGSGLGSISAQTLSTFKNWFKNKKNPSCVLDADIFGFEKIDELLTELNSTDNARIVLTPHIKELNSLFKALNYDFDDTDLFNSKSKIELGKKFTEQFPNITLVMKSANTFIASSEQIYICFDGNQSLAKAGSGDVLAGMITALLSQGYSSKDAAITAVEAHALASSSNGFEDSFALTPEKLIENLKYL